MHEKPTYEELLLRVEELEKAQADLKATGKELLETRRRMTTLIGNLPGMVYRCLDDSLWTMEFVSEGALPLTGYSAEDLVGNARISYYSIIHEEDREMVNNAVQEAVKQNEAFRIVYRIKTARGEEKWVWEQGRAVYDDEGKIVALEGVVNDISERRRAEEKLRDEIFWRRLLVEQSRDGIVVLKENGSIFESNLRFARMLGYSMEEVLGLHIWDWDARFSRDELLEKLRGVDEKGEQIESRHRRKDGTIIEVELSNNGIVYRGENLVFCISRDVSSRKKEEKERENLIKELRSALAEIKTLRGILPICSFCKNIRDDRGYWEQVDVYMHRHSLADFSHSICPDCLKKFYPDLDGDDE